MKKLFIAASLIIGMIAGAMVLSSFSEPKQGERNESTEITMADGWTRVGVYYGYDMDGDRSYYKFTIWEKEGMCNSYYWVYNSDKNPDETRSTTGVLRQNSEKKWYAALYGKNYYIDF